MIEDIVCNLITDYCSWHILKGYGSILNSEKFLQLCKQYNIRSGKENDFARLYSQAVVEYHCDSAYRKKTSAFFRDRVVMQAYYARLYENHSMEDLAEALSARWKNMAAQHPEFAEADHVREISDFTDILEALIKSTQSASDRLVATEILDRLDSLSKSRDSTNPPRFLTLIPPVNPEDVIGRENDLVDLRQELESSSSLLLMNGIGGIGKTTLAKIYVHRYGKEYDHLAWIELRGNLLDAVANNRSFLDSLGVAPYPDEPIEYLFHRTMHALQNLNTSGHNLLVLDNVDNSLQQFKSYLPHGPHWHVLLTSRQHLHSFRTMHLDTLARDAAIELFRKHCNKPQDNQALIAFLEKIQYHTLSIELFAKILDAHMNMETVGELAVYLDKNQLDDDNLQTIVELEHAGGETTPYRHLVHAFDLSGIAKRPELMRLMKQMAALPPSAEGYPVKELAEWFKIEKGQTTAFANELQKLYKLGWLVQPRKRHYSTQRLIKTIVPHAYPAAIEDLLPLVDTFIENLSLDETKDNPVDKFLWIPFGQDVLDTVQHLEFNEKTDLQNNLALVLQALGDYQGAKNLLQKAMVSAEKNLGPDHPTTAERYNSMVNVLYLLGDYQGAKLMGQKAIEIHEKIFGPNHPNAAMSYNNLAVVLRYLGDYQRANNLFLKAMKLHENNFGPNHPTTARIYANLASLLYHRGIYMGAKNLYLKALESHEKNLGPDHPLTALTYSNLAMVLKDLGNYQEAITLLNKAVQSDENNFGPNHPTTAVRYKNLAMVLMAMKKCTEARKLLEQAKEVFLSKLGEEHPHYKGVLELLARLDELEGKGSK